MTEPEFRTNPPYPAFTHGFDEYLRELDKDHWTETRWDYHFIDEDPENL